MADKAFKESPIPISIAFFIVLTLFAGAAIMLDYLLPSLYEKLSEKGSCRKVWLGAAYFSGLIPGFAILSFLGLYYAMVCALILSRRASSCWRFSALSSTGKSSSA